LECQEDRIMVRTISEIAARIAIGDIVYRYCRGMDRMDRKLVLSCWHPGGTDDHAPLYAGTAEGFVNFIFPVHAKMLCTRHEITNMIVEVNGDRAGVEAYWQVIHRIPVDGRAVDVRAHGRYVDIFERIDTRWAIRHRQSIRDWSRAEPVDGRAEGSQFQPFLVPNNPEAPETLGRRDEDDISYSVLEGIGCFAY
jgi:hypothetical protein